MCTNLHTHKQEPLNHEYRKALNPRTAKLLPPPRPPPTPTLKPEIPAAEA